MTPVLLLVAVLTGCGSTGVTGKEAAPPFSSQLLPDTSVTATEVLLLGGQSNAIGGSGAGVSPPEGIPTGTVALFRRVLFPAATALSDSALQQLKVSIVGSLSYHNYELSVGLRVRDGELAAHTKVIVVKCAAGGSFLTDWLAAGTYNAGLQSCIANAKTQIAAIFPNSGTPRWHFVWNQGENEADAGSSTPADNWAADFATLLAAIAGYTGQATIRPHIVRTYHLEGGSHLATVRSQQTSAAAAASGYILDVDGLLDTPGYMQDDDVHYTAAGHNAVGTGIIGPSILADIADNP